MEQGIPFVDLRAQYQSIRQEIDQAVQDCLVNSDFIRGEAVFRFEKEFSDYTGTEYCVSCGNGTDALEMILKALDIGKGDEVIVPAISWIATAEAVNNTGAEPVFADVDPVSCLIDSNRIEEKITSRTKAVIPVHLYGNPADMDKISTLAERYNIFVVEDCAQSHGAEFLGKKTGTFGIASAFSFFPGKNLGAFGDAGAVVTNDASIAEKVRMLSNHGQLKTKHSHRIIGRNSRMDTIHAAVLSVKLMHLDEWNTKRTEAAEQYTRLLKSIEGLALPVEDRKKKHAYHLFVIQCSERKKLTDAFEMNGIAYGIHYPNPIPFLSAYAYKNHKTDDFPAASGLTSRILSLPLFPEITSQQVERICSIVNEQVRGL